MANVIGISCTYSERLEVSYGIHGEIFIVLGLYFLLDPRVLESVLRSNSFIWIFRHHLRNEIFNFLTLVSPVFRFELESSLTNFCNDLLVVRSTEWWSSTTHDEKDDTDTPNVAKLVVLAIKHFRCDVVWSSVDLRHNVSMLD